MKKFTLPETAMANLLDTPILNLHVRMSYREVKQILILTRSQDSVDAITRTIVTRMHRCICRVDADSHTIIRIGPHGVTVWVIVLWHMGDLSRGGDRMRGWAFDRIYVYDVEPELVTEYFRSESLEQVTDETTGLRYWKFPEEGGPGAWPYLGSTPR